MTARKNSEGIDAAVALQYEITAIVREEIGLKEQLASQFANLILEGMRKRFGGADLYISTVDRVARNEAIRHDFNGRNHEEICRKYDISRTSLYRILNA